MMFLLGTIFGVLLGAAMMQVIVTRQQKANWEQAIVERRQAERRSQALERQIRKLTVIHATEVRMLKRDSEKVMEQHRYLLRRADSALTAAREARTLQAVQLAGMSEDRQQPFGKTA